MNIKAAMCVVLLLFVELIMTQSYPDLHDPVTDYVAFRNSCSSQQNALHQSQLKKTLKTQTQFKGSFYPHNNTVLMTLPRYQFLDISYVTIPCPTLDNGYAGRFMYMGSSVGFLRIFNNSIVIDVLIDQTVRMQILLDSYGYSHQECLNDLMVKPSLCSKQQQQTKIKKNLTINDYQFIGDLVRVFMTQHLPNVSFTRRSFMFEGIRGILILIIAIVIIQRQIQNLNTITYSSLLIVVFCLYYMYYFQYGIQIVYKDISLIFLLAFNFYFYTQIIDTTQKKLYCGFTAIITVRFIADYFIFYHMLGYFAFIIELSIIIYGLIMIFRSCANYFVFSVMILSFYQLIIAFIRSYLIKITVFQLILNLLSRPNHQHAIGNVGDIIGVIGQTLKGDQLENDEMLGLLIFSFTISFVAFNLVTFIIVYTATTSQIRQKICLFEFTLSFFVVNIPTVFIQPILMMIGIQLEKKNKRNLLATGMLIFLYISFFYAIDVLIVTIILGTIQLLISNEAATQSFSLLMLRKFIEDGLFIDFKLHYKQVKRDGLKLLASVNSSYRIISECLQRQAILTHGFLTSTATKIQSCTTNNIGKIVTVLHALDKDVQQMSINGKTFRPACYHLLSLTKELVDGVVLIDYTSTTDTYEKEIIQLTNDEDITEPDHYLFYHYPHGQEQVITQLSADKVDTYNGFVTVDLPTKPGSSGGSLYAVQKERKKLTHLYFGYCTLNKKKKRHIFLPFNLNNVLFSGSLQDVQNYVVEQVHDYRHQNDVSFDSSCFQNDNALFYQDMQLLYKQRLKKKQAQESDTDQLLSQKVKKIVPAVFAESIMSDPNFKKQVRQLAESLNRVPYSEHQYRPRQSQQQQSQQPLTQRKKLQRQNKKFNPDAPEFKFDQSSLNTQNQQKQQQQQQQYQ